MLIITSQLIQIEHLSCNLSISAQYVAGHRKRALMEAKVKMYFLLFGTENYMNLNSIMFEGTN